MSTTLNDEEPPMATAGVLMTLAVVPATLGCAWLQYLGVRRLA